MDKTGADSVLNFSKNTGGTIKVSITCKGYTLSNTVQTSATANVYFNNILLGNFSCSGYTNNPDWESANASSSKEYTI